MTTLTPAPPRSLDDWDDASTATYTAREFVIGDRWHLVVCLDDEGPMRPAYYWAIEDFERDERIDDGWERTPHRCRNAIVRRAKELNLE